MERILFKALSADYLVSSKYIKGTEADYHTVFSAVYRLNIVYDEGNNRYNCKINRSDVLIDGKPVKKLMDRILLEIGDGIYPLSLNISPNLQITNILNYEEVKNRWTNRTRKLLKKYPSYPMTRYVKMSGKNISDREKLVDALYRDTFFNVYFRDIYSPTADKEAYPILWVNFPERGMNLTYLYEINPMKESKINTSGDVMQIVPGQEGHLTMDYKLGEKGEIHGITGIVESRHQNKLYMKQISVKSENVKTDDYFIENIIM